MKFNQTDYISLSHFHFLYGRDEAFAKLEMEWQPNSVDLNIEFYVCVFVYVDLF